MADPGPSTPLTVLVMCTANISRSPMGEALLRRQAALAQLPIEVSSAGFHYEGEPAAPHAVSVMSAMGLDLSGHRSRIYTPEMVRAADLIVTMERTHARSIALDVADVSERVHTIGAAVVGLDGSGDGAVRERIAELGRSRAASDLLGRGDDEVDDPYKHGRRRYRRTARELDRLMAALVAALARS